MKGLRYADFKSKLCYYAKSLWDDIHTIWSFPNFSVLKDTEIERRILGKAAY